MTDSHEVHRSALPIPDLAYTGTWRIERTNGVWRKVGFLLAVPQTATHGQTTLTIRQVLGIMEIDGFSLRAVADRESDALNNFLKGSDVE